MLASRHVLRRTVAALGLSLVVLGVARAAPLPPEPSRRPASTIAHLLPTRDTYANEDFPDTNYGTAPSLVVARTTEFLTLRRPFLRFELGSLPANATIISATLRLYHAAGTGPPVSVGVRPVTQTWGANSLTWRNQPPAGSPVATTALTDRVGWRMWPVTALVQGWVDGSIPNQGLSLRGPETSDVEWSHTLHSREGARAPVLDVEYEVPTPTPTPSATAGPCVDVSEPNNDMAHAAPLAPGVEVTGCMPTPGDLDFFTFGAPAENLVTVELFDLPVDLNLYLLAADGTTLAASTQSGTAAERVDHVTAPVDEPLFVRVQSAGGWDLQDGYHLKLTLTPLLPTPGTATATPTLPTTATATVTATPTPEASATSATDQTATPTLRVPPPPTASATPDWSSVGGRVWEDSDRDGLQDAREDGVDRVGLSLVREGAVVARAVTDNEGYYVFATLAGDVLYRVDVDDDTVPVPLARTTCCDPVIVRPRAGLDLRGADFGYAMPPTPTPTATGLVRVPNMDLRIAGIEVTQATQCFDEAADLDGCTDGDNSIPLVGGRTTVARVYVALGQEGAGMPTARRMWDVEVRLLAWDAGTGEMLPGAPLEATIDFVNADVPLDNVRDYASRSANFQLPDEWTSAELASGIDLNAVLVDRADECPDCSANNDHIERGLVFAESSTLRVYPVRIRYTRGDNDVSPSEDAAEGLYAKLLKLYPVDEEQVFVHADADRVLRTDRNLGSNDGISELLDDMADRYVCYEDDFWACGWAEGHYYGVISTTVQLGPASPEEPNGRWNGMGRVYDCVAVGREGQTGTAAHEIGHNLGREHASNDHDEAEGGDWEEWPYPHGGIGVVGFDTTGMRARPLGDPDGLHWHDLMSYGGGFGKWISPHNYLALGNDLGFCTEGSPGLRTNAGAPAGQPTSGPAEPRHFWLVAGQLKPDPELRPIFKVSARAGASPPTGPGRYALELRNAAGATLARKPFDPIEDHVAQGESMDHFRQYVPDVAGVAQVVLFDGARELLRRAVSANVPTVAVTEPSAATRWPASGAATVRWTAADDDGDDLTYVVMYSRDGGTTWVNLATGLTETNYSVELATLGGSPDQARIRVLANDGLRTGVGDSALFGVASQGPRASIELPEPGDLPFAEGLPVRFQGIGYDAEDGLLNPRLLEWRDASGRLLGTGASLVLRTLGAGTHTVHLRVADSDGNAAEDTRTVVVGELLWLPAVANHAGPP